ncbi:heavy-metal-associated domain-containing protein [Flavobacterium selenitireducens]|uniref:heavy-metal-associated domain-containing protein n=1 Tax=Flavobacterium selenitireducens TaxID=2722704 RepID=UPI00168B3345|nr:MauE/DoxX family redox-associated membrane protein [Flavobacterium selenitireducens]MBD3581500.1 heavy-metal-associated domain-containing protein [Flavobacterium selenitireducens]
MTHTYHISGMTCSGCEFKVKSRLLQVDGITAADVSLENEQATLSMNAHIEISKLQQALGTDGKYTISADPNNQASEAPRSWFETYRPILFIFAYISAISLLAQLENSAFDRMQFMRHFMAGFFLTFSFFKMLNLKGFAQSYVMYDVIARAIPAWAYLYAFVELGLGIAYLVDFSPIATNLVTFVVMSLSIIGVLKTVLDKKTIQCACLGAVFNLPMSTVTIIEDGLMIAMSGWMLWTLL